MQEQVREGLKNFRNLEMWVRSLPLLNIRAEKIKLFNPWRDHTYTLSQIEMTKAEYDEISDDWKGPDPLSCGRFSVRVAMFGPTGGTALRTVFLTDCPEDPAPVP